MQNHHVKLRKTMILYADKVIDIYDIISRISQNPGEKIKDIYWKLVVI